MSQKDKINLKELCLFLSLVYVHAWLSAPITTDAPVNDLKPLKTLGKYKVQINQSDHFIEDFRKVNRWLFGILGQSSNREKEKYTSINMGSWKRRLDRTHNPTKFVEKSY
jgi:hypothetical protein